MNPGELDELLRYREALDSIASDPEPTARLIAAPTAAVGRLRSVAVLPGAFNPPTNAHLGLADHAAGLGFDALFLSLGRVTLDKEISGLLLEDRLWLLVRLAAGSRRLGVLLQNRGLYEEIAEAVHRLIPTLEDLAFVIGMDKVRQLFDPRYYDDIESRLARLFTRARFLVAPRGEEERDALTRMLSDPRARRHAGRFQWLPLPRELSEISATAVRESAAQALATGHLPPDVSAFLERTRAFSGDRTYDERRRILDRSLKVDGS